MAQKIKRPAASLQARARKIRLVAMDVDGVLTGGEIIVLESSEEVKMWNAKDRLVMALIRDLRIPLTLAWITGRSSKTVSWSANDLGVKYVVQGSKNKKADLEKILKENDLAFEEAAFIGDDLIDLPVLKAVGLSACPSDAVPDILSAANYVSPIAGGRGCARDVIEFILRAQGKWDALTDRFLS